MSQELIPNSSEQPTKSKTPSNLPGFVAIIISLIAIATAATVGFFELRLTQNYVQLDNQAQYLKNGISQIKLDSDEQQKNLSTVQTQLQKLQTQNNAIQKELVLSEAAHLIRLANWQLTLANNLPIAVKLLQTADKQLAELSDQSLISTRQMLNSQISTLESISKVDTAGLIMRLNTLNQQINLLPLPVNNVVPQSNASEIKNDTTLPLWRKALNTALDALRSAVVIRKHEQASKLLPSDNELILLRENIQFQLMQAQWAVLNQQVEIYQTSIKQTMQWISQYFQGDASITQQVLTNLAELSKISIKPNIPDISSALESLEKSLQTQPSPTTLPTEPQIQKQNNSTPGINVLPS